MNLGVRHEHAELVPAIPGSNVHLPAVRFDDLGRAAQDHVTVLMAEPIVGLLESIKVDHHERERLIAAHRLGPSAIELLVQVAPVVEPGEIVRSSHRLELAIGILELLILEGKLVQGATEVQVKLLVLVLDALMSETFLQSQRQRP